MAGWCRCRMLMSTALLMGRNGTAAQVHLTEARVQSAAAADNVLRIVRLLLLMLRSIHWMRGRSRLLCDRIRGGGGGILLVRE